MSDTDKAAADLAVLLPGRDVTCKGESIKVLPLFFGQYPTAIKLVRPLITVLTQSGMFSAVQDGANVRFTVSKDWLSMIPYLLEEGGEAMMKFFAFAIKKQREWFDTLPADEGLALAVALFEENQDFFVRRILPMLKTMGLMKESEGSAGDPSSQSSEATATAGQTSN